MKQQLLQQPKLFFSTLLNAAEWFNITDKTQPLLPVQYQVPQYTNVFFNLFSFNNFYINTLFFSFFVFAGSMALFKVFYSVFKNALPAFCIFLLPSILFWTSVIYKEGFFFMAAGFFFLFPAQAGK